MPTSGRLCGARVLPGSACPGNVGGLGIGRRNDNGPQRSDGAGDRSRGRRGLFDGKQERHQEDHQAQDDQAQAGVERISPGRALAGPCDEDLASIGRRPSAGRMVAAADGRCGVCQNFGHDRLDSRCGNWASVWNAPPRRDVMHSCNHNVFGPEIQARDPGREICRSVEHRDVWPDSLRNAPPNAGAI